MMGRVRMCGQLLVRGVSSVLGRGYYHVPQDLGRAFRPGQLEGYFNDLTAKTAWPGPIDERGVPLNIRSDGQRVYFATTIAQKALGHWDRWLLDGREEDRVSFLVLVDWLVENQDEQGGWSLWPQLGLSLPSPYSAMTQGEGASALVRAWRLSGQPRYLEAARRALQPILCPIEEGGTLRRVRDGLILEEFPAPRTSGILNGWVFSLFGIYDYLLVEEDARAECVLRKTVESLVACLPCYDAGYWSFYDLRGNLASPFYHRLHIAQMMALALICPEHATMFEMMEERFQRQMQSVLGRLKAIAMKGYQTVRARSEVVLR